MPPKIQGPDRRLIAAYQEAALRLSRILADVSPANRRILLRRIDLLLSELDQLTAKYLSEALPLHFRDGSDEAIERLRKVQGFGEIDRTFGTIHTEALQALADDATLKFANALEGVKRETRSVITKANKEAVIRELIASEIEGAAAPEKRVAELFRDQGVTAFQGARRKWTLEDYSAMLTRTILADAHNTGATTRYASNGVQFVRIIEREDAPDVTCRWMRGKVVSIADRRLLNPYHPGCMGGLEPYLGDTSEAILTAEDPRIPDKVRKMLLKRG
jgi:hypothetical protein